MGSFDRGLHVQHTGIGCHVHLVFFIICKLQAHNGAVVSLTYSPSYVVSLGEDGKLCVWERFQGHLINSVDTVGNSEVLEYLYVSFLL